MLKLQKWWNTSEPQASAQFSEEENATWSFRDGTFAAFHSLGSELGSLQAICVPLATLEYTPKLVM